MNIEFTQGQCFCNQFGKIAAFLNESGNLYAA